jgi:hypothetical protein
MAGSPGFSPFTIWHTKLRSHPSASERCSLAFASHTKGCIGADGSSPHRIEDIMTSPVHTCSVAETAVRPAQLMWDSDWRTRASERKRRLFIVLPLLSPLSVSSTRSRARRGGRAFEIGEDR